MWPQPTFLVHQMKNEDWSLFSFSIVCVNYESFKSRVKAGQNHLCVALVQLANIQYDTNVRPGVKGEVSPNNNVNLVSRKQFKKPNSKILSKFG